MRRRLLLPLLALASLGADCNGPFEDCTLVENGVLVDDGVAEDATFVLASDGSIVAAFITGAERTVTELRRLGAAGWESVVLANSHTDPLYWEANFHNIVVTSDDRFHLIGSFASADDLFDGDGRLYQLSSLVDSSGATAWNTWPDLDAAVAFTDDAGFDFGAVGVTDSLDRIWVVFISDRPGAGATDSLWITHRDPQLGWQTPTPITAPAKRDTFPQVHLDKHDRLQLVWVRTHGERLALLDGVGQEQEIVTMTSDVLDANFTGAEWGPERQLVVSGPTSVNTLPTSFEGPADSYATWISQDYSVAGAPGLTPVAALAAGTVSEFPVTDQLHRSLRLPGDQYLHAWTAGFATGHTSILYRIHDCSAP